jgi:hypothetical protein
MSSFLLCSQQQLGQTASLPSSCSVDFLRPSKQTPRQKMINQM